MNCAFQRSWYTSSRLEDEDRLVTEVGYNDYDWECCARLAVDPKTFVIDKAWWELYRINGKTECRIIELPQLAGIEAYFGCAPRLREGLSSLQEGNYYARRLFAELIRGTIQAETFLLWERGFASREEYGRYFEKISADACRYYKNLDRVTVRWDDYIGNFHRKGRLFARVKDITLYDLNDSYLLKGQLNDSFHGITMELSVDKGSGKTQKAEGNLHRVPDKVCQEAREFLPGLIGINIREINKKELAELLGNNNGCVHLIDLIFDGIEAISLMEYRK